MKNKEKVVFRRTATVALCPGNASTFQMVLPGWPLGKWRCHRQPLKPILNLFKPKIKIKPKSGRFKPENVALHAMAAPVPVDRWRN